MKGFAAIVCWIVVVVTGIFLRFDDLERRPMHADEATGARITAARMESGGAAFDPKHYHGPLLGDLVMPVCRLRGETGWGKMRKETLRCLPALAGCLLVLTPLLWRRRFGDAPMLLAAACLATSPLLVYYSRMFIHEMLLVWLGLLVVVTFGWKPKWGLTGVLLGLMFAVKETFAISVLAWGGAAVLLALESHKLLTRETIFSAWRKWKTAVLVTLATAALTAVVFYTRCFTHPAGALDAVRTFFVYEVVDGHDKPPGYYFQFLALPTKAAGVWWFETPVLVLALLAYGSSFGDRMALRSRFAIRFLAYAAGGHLVVYSLISYKTPWLACLPWAHVCLLAGFALAGFEKRSRIVRGLLVVLVAGGLVSQWTRARLATGRLEADGRNPYAYVPTRPDVERLAEWLEKVRAVAPDGAMDSAAVIGTGYWPLPWYLREFEEVGYWPIVPDGLAQMPVVFVMPGEAAAVTAVLASTHVSVPRGLRVDVPVLVFLRNDIWEAWMNPDS